MSVFSEWLDITLSNRKISGREFAKRTGLHETAISKYRTGQAKPSMKAVARIARELGEDPMRVAATVDPEDFDAEPLETPTPTAKRDTVRRRIASIPGTTAATRQKLLEEYDRICMEGT